MSCNNLLPLTSVIDIVTYYCENRTASGREVAEKFGITETIVSNILNMKGRYSKPPFAGCIEAVLDYYELKYAGYGTVKRGKKAGRFPGSEYSNDKVTPKLAAQIVDYLRTAESTYNKARDKFKVSTAEIACIAGCKGKYGKLPYYHKPIDNEGADFFRYTPTKYPPKFIVYLDERMAKLREELGADERAGRYFMADAKLKFRINISHLVAVLIFRRRNGYTSIPKVGTPEYAAWRKYHNV